MTDRRGYNHAAAIKYLGIGRRSFEALVRPHLNPVRIGNNLIFDRIELDAVLDRFKSGELPDGTEQQQNGGGNGWPTTEEGAFTWAEKRRASRPSPMEPGRSIRYGEVADFEGVASSIMRKRRAG